MRRILGAALVIMVCVASARGQRYPILPVAGSPPAVTALLQDSRSQIWVATGNGLFVFDGVRFYSMEPFGFPKENVTSLAEDADGAIWALTSDDVSTGTRIPGGVYRYQAGRVEKIRTGGGLSIVNIAPGVMLASVDNIMSGFGDLYRFRRGKSGWDADLIDRGDASLLTVGHDGKAMFGCREDRCELTRNQIENWPAKGTEVFRSYPGSNSSISRRLGHDRFDCLWERSATEAGFACPGATKATVMDQDISSYTDASFTLVEGPDGRMLMLDNLVYGRPGAFKVARFENGVPNGLDAAVIGRDGTIWLGGAGGIYRFMHPFELEYWNRDDGVDAPYTVLHAGRKVFFGNNGVSTLDATRRHWVQLPRKTLGTVVHMIQNRDGTVSSISLVVGLHSFTSEGKIIAGPSLGALGARLAQAYDGTLWAAGDGIYRVMRHGSHFELTSEDIDKQTDLDMEYDNARKTLWACHWNGIAAKTPDGWHFLGSKDGLRDDYCRTIAVHPNGDVWVGYGDLGAFSLIKNAFSPNMTIRNYSSGGDVGEAGTMFLDADRRGWLWRASAGEDYLAAPAAAEAGEWLQLDTDDGIPTPGGNQNAFSNDPDGSVWFASSDTIVHFSPPPGFATDFPAPALFISSFSAQKLAATPIVGVPVVPRSTDLVAHIGSLQFDRRTALRFRYRVLPDNKNWTDTASFNIPLGKLMWGHHTLQIQGRMLTGPWSPVAEQALTVPWPFWLTWPGLLTIAASGTGLGFGIRQWINRQKYLRSLAFPDMAAWRMDALSPAVEQLIGTVVAGRYEIGHILAIGGFSTVTRARDLQDGGQLRAVKIFREDSADEAWLRHRFEHEVAALEQVSHPSVVKITDHGTMESGAPYLVMEFIHGRSLREMLDAGPLAKPQVARFLRQIAGALAVLHEAAIYHRDLKPENLMVRVDDDGLEQIVLIDFSIALVKAPDKTFHGISRVAGTLGYMAPEQVTGYADSSTDIHSLAKVLIEMLTGAPCVDLFPEASLELSQAATEYFDRNTGLLARESVLLVSSALRFDPRQRPHDVSAFAAPIVEDLERNS